LLMNDYQTLVASNGVEGFYLASKQKPDLILSDIMMPEMSGLELLELIQKNGDLVDIPFIFLTAKIGNLDVRKGMNLGADDYLMKPIKTKELLTSIEKRLDKREQTRKIWEDNFNKLLTNLNNTASHEFNTPLNGILGAAELLKSGHIPNPDKLKLFAHMIFESGQRLKATLDNIMLYRSIVSQRLRKLDAASSLESLMIEEWGQKVAQKYNREADLELKGLHNCYIPNSSWHYLKVIFVELIDNAFKFSTKGQPVTISQVMSDNQVFFEIIDQGFGMTEDEINQVGAYHQFHKEHYAQQGMGLGLFLSKELIKLHKADFKIIPNHDHGVTCRLKFNVLSLDEIANLYERSTPS